MTHEAIEQRDRNSIYAIEVASPRWTNDEREAIADSEVDAALGAYVPGGARVYCWLPMADGHTIHDTARDVMRSALASAAKVRHQSTTSLEEERDALAKRVADLEAAPDEDWLTDVIDDSLDMDWTGRVGARAIIAAWGQRHGS